MSSHTITFIKKKKIIFKKAYSNYGWNYTPNIKVYWCMTLYSWVLYNFVGILFKDEIFLLESHNVRGHRFIYYIYINFKKSDSDM